MTIFVVIVSAKNYHCQSKNVVCLFACMLVCLPARLLTKFSTDFGETFRGLRRQHVTVD